MLRRTPHRFLDEPLRHHRVEQYTIVRFQTCVTDFSHALTESKRQRRRALEFADHVRPSEV